MSIAEPPPKPLKMLHCAAGNLFGGVETLLVSFARARAEYPRLDSEFALCYEGRLSEEVAEASASVHQLGRARFSRPWTVWNARRRLRRIIRERGIDVVVTHGCWAHWLAAPAAKSLAKPVVFWMHDMIGEGLPHRIDRQAAKHVPARVIVNSFATAETLPRLFPNVQGELIRYPIAPLPAFDRKAVRDDIRFLFDTDDNDVVIIMTARLERWKGHSFLLDALGRLKDKPGWTAWIVGGRQRRDEWPYIDELEKIALGHGVRPRLRTPGQRSDIPQLLISADIHCQPNLGPEPFGITFIEGLYAGLPVVTSNIGGAAEIVNEHCGRLVPAGDVDALAEALRELIDDPAKRAALGSAGPARAAELCGWSNVLPKLERFLSDAVA